MSNKRKRTLRVPKKVTERAAAALRAQDGIGLGSGQDMFIAAALASATPVTTDVPGTMAQFFASDWRYNPAKLSKAALYGGEAGQKWANNIVTMLALNEPDPTLDEEMTLEELFDIKPEEHEAIMEFLNTLGPVVPEAKKAAKNIEKAEKAKEMSVQPAEMEVGATSDDAVDELGEHIETALGLATQLDETIEKLADALDEALAETEEADALETDMVQAALSEIGVELDDADFAVAAAEARERMAKATLIRERSMAMAKMASVRSPAKVAETVEVAVVAGRARLAEPMPLVTDTKGRLDSYLQWAQDQMGVETA